MKRFIFQVLNENGSDAKYSGTDNYFKWHTKGKDEEEARLNALKDFKPGIKLRLCKVL